MDDIEDTPPLEVDPYGVLEIETSASANEVKAAYRKLALRYHPDKVLPVEQETAKVKFQEIAFAYAILSDDRRRKRYDATGNTSESLDLEDDDFNWVDFFRAQWAETITADKIDSFQKSYQGSDEERQDVRKAYERFQGDLDKVFQHVMLSNPLHDEDRFREYIEAFVAAGDVPYHDAYTLEPESKKIRRRQNALKEAEKAKEHAEDLGLNANGDGGAAGTGTGKGGKAGKKNKNGPANHDLGSLAAMIQQRQRGRAANFLDDLEAKYAAPQKGSKKGKGGKGRATNKNEDIGEPSEEAFRATAARAEKRKRAIIEDDEDGEDLDAEDGGEEKEDDDSDDDDFVSEDNEDDFRPSKRNKTKAAPVVKKKKTSGRARAKGH